MKRLRDKLTEWLKAPYGWGLFGLFMLLIGTLAATVTIIVLAPGGHVFEVLSYILYGLSFFLFGYTVYAVVVQIRKKYLALSEKNALLGRLREDFEYRTLIFSVGSALFATLVSGYYFTLFGLSRSLWFGTLGSYYFILALIRGWVLATRRSAVLNGESEEKIRLRDARCYLGSGAMFVLLALAFAVMLTFTVGQGFHREYVGLTIYVAALYATLKIVFAIVNLVRAKKREDLTVRTLRNVNIADALVSVVALQAAMLQQFLTEESVLDARLFNAVTGGIVLAVIIAMGSYMIVKGHRRLQALEEEQRRK